MLHNNVARYLIHNYLEKGYLEESQEQHREIVALCRDQDPDRACQKLVDHLGHPVAVIQAGGELSPATLT
jgi:DNA-binding GntR family transcriptional regulator